MGNPRSIPPVAQPPVLNIPELHEEPPELAHVPINRLVDVDFLHLNPEPDAVSCYEIMVYLAEIIRHRCSDFWHWMQNR